MTSQPPNQPTALTSLLKEAGKALGNRQYDKAEAALSRVFASSPRCAEAYRLSGISLQMRGRHSQALKPLKAALALEPDNALIHMNLGTVFYAVNDVASALSSLHRACELMPHAPAVWFNLGKMLKLQKRPDAALHALERALELDPAHVPARLILADVQVSLGKTRAARANYRTILQRQPDCAEAWIALANLKSSAFEPRDISTLRQLLATAHMPIDKQVMLAFALANAHEEMKDYPAAFAAFQRANALKRQHLCWDASAFHVRVQAIITAFPTPAHGATDKSLGSEVIFITCLPRSGSSLTEQILASHSLVEGAGELTDLQDVIAGESKRRGQPYPQWVPAATPSDWDRLGKEYLARTQSWRRRHPRFCDKNLLNWMYVGAAMAMLPGARIVNSRRNSLENCFGCFRQFFPRGNDFSYTLREMAAYWQDYDRLSKHWQSLFPQQFFDHEHESLLADPEAQIRRLLHACGLEYEPACLEFHRTQRAVHTASAAQVRQPITVQTTYVERYGQLLDELQGLLG